MVTVTERAATALQQVLEDNHAPPGQGVRLAADATGHLGMTIDAPRDGDDVVYAAEEPVLMVAGPVAGQLEDMVLDYQASDDDSQTSAGFVLRPDQQVA
jgi:Fe-S cluster assembly iron-binding protein IscA